MRVKERLLSVSCFPLCRGCHSLFRSSGPTPTAPTSPSATARGGPSGDAPEGCTQSGSCLPSVASASTTLSWRLKTETGLHDGSIPFAGHSLLGAVESSLVMLAVMAIVAGAVSLVGPRRLAAP